MPEKLRRIKSSDLVLCQTVRVGKRQQARDRIEAQIIDIGRRHLVTEGAAGLSLRAIARDLGMVSSAVYRYVASRDDLLTLLLVDAYTELGDAVDAACAPPAGPPDAWDARLTALAHAVRRWALQQPARWALLYGSPVPGYHAPAERTVTPGTRVIAAVFTIVADGIAADHLPATIGPDAGRDTDLAVPQQLSADFDRLRAEFGFPGGDAWMGKCFLFWAALVGAVSLEVFGQYGAGTLTEPRDAFDLQLRLLLTVVRE